MPTSSRRSRQLRCLVGLTAAGLLGGCAQSDGQPGAPQVAPSPVRTSLDYETEVYPAGSQPPTVPSVAFKAGQVVIGAHGGPEPDGHAVADLAIGAGPVITDPASIRIAYVVETWKAGPRLHDSWAAHTLQEPLSSTPSTRGLLQYFAHARVGYRLELLCGPDGWQHGLTAVTIVVAELTAGH